MTSIGPQMMNVKSNLNPGSFVISLPEMFNERKFVDVTLASEGRRIHCHRIVLSAFSPYLADILEENITQHPIIIFSGEMKFWMIQALVTFMYFGEVNVAREDLGELIKCAQALKIRDFMTPTCHNTEESDHEMVQQQPLKELNQGRKTELSERKKWDNTESFGNDVQLCEAILEPAENNIKDSEAEDARQGSSSSRVLQKKSKKRNRSSSDLFECKYEDESTDANDGDRSMDFSTKEKKLKMLNTPNESPPKDFNLSVCYGRRKFDEQSMWSALMKIKNGEMSMTKAGKTFKIAPKTLRRYMERYNIKSKFNPKD